jgi:hypothetical protein
MVLALLMEQAKTSRLLLLTMIFVLCHVEIRDREPWSYAFVLGFLPL